MISRQKFLARLPQANVIPQQQVEEEEDVWYQTEKLSKDHIHEVLSKWRQIDDEIWAKIIVFERNRRVAKAYARAPVLTVNGSNEEFDGFRLGLTGFDSPMKDRRTEEFKRHIGHGIKIKMDDAGNVLVKRVSKSNVFVKNVNPEEENAISHDIMKLPNWALQMDKPMKLFDMKKFQSNMKRELRQSYPDRRKLERQCLSALSFVKDEHELLECPIWIMIVNVVAIDMLKSKLPPNEKLVDIRDRPRFPVPDEDPYSLPGTGKLNSSTKEMLLRSLPNMYRGEKPPRLPPRENYASKSDIKSNGHSATMQSNEASKDKKQYEDPYYSGLRARVSSFVFKTKSKVKKPTPTQPSYPPPQHPAPSPFTEQKSQPPSQNQTKQVQKQQNNTHSLSIHQHPMWYTRSIESGLNTEFSESPYTKIYGRIPIPRGYVPQHRIMHIGTDHGIGFYVVKLIQMENKDITATKKRWFSAGDSNRQFF